MKTEVKALFVGAVAVVVVGCAAISEEGAPWWLDGKPNAEIAEYLKTRSSEDLCVGWDKPSPYSKRVKIT